MAGFPLKQAIQSGGWLQCTGYDYDVDLHFRVRVLGFSPTTLEELTENEPDTQINAELEGVLWILFLEVVNLNKKPVAAHDLYMIVKVTDADGYQFDPFEEETDLYDIKPFDRFGYSAGPLSPKLKAKGAIAFVLPDEESDYNLLISGRGRDDEEGSVKEL